MRSGGAAGADRAEQRGAQIAVTAVGEEGDDCARRHRFGHPQGRGHRRPARHAGEDPLAHRQLAGGLEGLFVLDDELGVELLFPRITSYNVCYTKLLRQ